MSEAFAALPMYDWPESRAETDREWLAMRERLRVAGIAAPERLVRRNAEMPAVPGGIRNERGEVIALEPSTLPPDELDLSTLWRHPAMLMGQTCWGPMEEGLEAHVTVIGQPDYSAFEGGEGVLYSSAILMRRGLPSPLWGGLIREAERGGDEASRSPTPILSLHAGPPHKGEGDEWRGMISNFRGRRFAFNSRDSMSGLIAMDRDLAASGETLALFSALIETGSHRASIVAVAEGRADVCTVDCRTWDLAKRFEPAAAEVRVVGWTAKRKGLPFITSRLTPPETVAALREALQARPSSRASRG